ncbi:glycosyltransferase family 2 protein [Nocardioides sp.]|uniref:glycosyltransferase family 2 protein n=1 Tax=Nocardioides sp. TaxID=35761 RepID=UPI0035B0591A
MTRVSIVIPCFNDGAHLREAVESALAQDHDDCEVLVADDGSTDAATLRELDTLDELGVRVLCLDHAGVSSTRNSAIAAASGDHVLPLDADDRLAPAYAGEASRLLDADPAVGIVGAGTEFFGSDAGVIHPDVPRPEAWLVANQLPVSAMFRRADWTEAGGYAQDLRWGEDWHFWVKVVALGREVRVLPEIGLYYRRRPGQVTTHVPWDVQEATRARILQAGIPIVTRFPEDSTSIIASQLNQLQAVKERRSERLRSAALHTWRRRSGRPHL